MVIKNGSLIYYDSLHNVYIFYFISAFPIITRIIDHLLFDFYFFSTCLFIWFLFTFKFAERKHFNL